MTPIRETACSMEKMPCRALRMGKFSPIFQKPKMKASHSAPVAGRTQLSGTRQRTIRAGQFHQPPHLALTYPDGAAERVEEVEREQADQQSEHRVEPQLPGEEPGAEMQSIAQRHYSCRPTCC